ncbi:YbbR-like domain-containing protein [Formosa sediminum]|uniref:YbbR-like domain-containing protein n=1 Tax=Formosa sediminum TaxID=2594004 RepID=A0A516GVP6_9FLAO|nr:YbbR-like domain-containing protein [Formosa sediminum]QDO95594.1 YbbR-like domain-containing protein [Formosa sediminum]
MKDLKSRLLKFVKSKKINIFTLFLLLSFTILVLNKLSRTYINTITFPVETVNLPETYVILNDSNQALNVTLKTYGFKLLRYYISKPKLILDYKDKLQLTDSTYLWSSHRSYSKINAQFDKDIEVVNLSPDTLYFNYDQNATKDVPVVLQENIKFSPGFDVLEGFKVVPDSVHIVGPEKLLKAITAIKTVPLELEDVHLDLNQNISLDLPNSDHLITFSHHKVHLEAKVEKFTEGTFNIPVTLKNVPQNVVLKYYPKSVSVSYYTTLSGFNEVQAKDFKVECDYSERVANQSFLVPKLVKQPEKVKSAKIIHPKVEYIISE